MGCTCTKAWVVLVAHDILRFATKMHVALNCEPRDNLHLYVTAVKLQFIYGD